MHCECIVLVYLYEARNVVIWLGDAEHESHLAMNYIKEMHSLVECGKEDMISDEVAVRDWPLSFFPTVPLSDAHLEAMTGFYKLLRRPWWYRAWIVQEMGLAQSIVVQCGMDIVTFTQLRVTLLITRTTHPTYISHTELIRKEIAHDASMEWDWPSAAINNALNLEYCRRMIMKSAISANELGYHTPKDVSWAFWFTRARLCREPHGRTFSLLGVAGNKFRENLRKDYADPPEEHDRNTVRAYVDATNSLDIILRSQHSVWLPHNSSWAPDWSQPERAGVFHLNGQSLKTPLPYHHGDAEMQQGSGILSVKGRIIGVVRNTRLEVGHLVADDANICRETMPVTALADPDKGFSRYRRWWIFKPKFEKGEMFNNALAGLPRDHSLWKAHSELFLAMFETLFRKVPSSTYSELQRSNETSIPAAEQFQDLEPFFDLLEYLLISRSVCELNDTRLLVAPGSRPTRRLGSNSGGMFQPSGLEKVS